MRDVLTVLAVALIAILIVALAGPHFIDWNSQRAHIDAALGEALGLEVETRGAIDLRLLPSPVLQLEVASVRGLRRAGGQQAHPEKAVSVLGDPAASQSEPPLRTGKIRVELALAPLLGGKWQIADASIDRPVLRLTWPVVAIAAGAGSTTTPASSYSGPAVRPSLDALRITNGVLIVSEPNGERRFVRDGINASLQAAALNGPWRASGTVGYVPFNLNTGELGLDGVMRLRVSAGEPISGRTEFDGQANFATLANLATPAKAMASPDAKPGLPGISGRVSYQRLLEARTGNNDRGNGSAPRIHLTADASLTGVAFNAQNIRFELGDPNAPIRFEGHGGGELIAGKALEFDLKARRLDISAAAQGAQDPHLDPFAAVTALIQTVTSDAGRMPAVNFRLAAEAVAWGEEETGAAALGMRVADGVVTLGDGRVALPGASVLTMSGNMRATPRPFISLNARLDAPQPALLAPWLKRLGASDDVAGWIGRQQRLTLAGGIGASREMLAVHGLKLQTADGELSGLIASRAGDVRTPSRLDAQVSARGLDFAALPSGLWSGSVLDRVIFHDEDGHVDATLGFTGAGLRFGNAAAAGSVVLRASRTRQGVAVADLSVANLGGVDITASGSLTGEGKPLSGKITASSMAPLASLAEKIFLADAQTPAAPALDWVLQGLRRLGLARPVNLAFSTDMHAGGGAALSFTGDLAAADQQRGAAGGGVALPFARAEGRLVFAQPDRVGALRLTTGSVRLNGPNTDEVLSALGPGSAAIVSSGPAMTPGLAAVPWRATIDLLPDADGVRAHVAIDAANARMTLTPDAGGARLELAAQPTSILATGLAGALGLPRATPEALKLDGRLRWPTAKQPWSLDFRGTAGGAPVSGIINALGDSGLAAEIQLEQLSLPALAQTLVLGPVVAGDATWSSRRFAAAPMLFDDAATGAARAMEVSFRARRLDLGAGFSVANARLGVSALEDGMRFALAPSPLSIAGRGDGGKLAGAMVLRRQGGAAAMTADVRLTDAQLGAWGVRGLQGVAALDLRAGASGESVAGLVANLAGNGEVRLGQGRLPQLAPNAPAEAVRRLSGDVKALSGNALLVSVGEQLNTGSFTLGDIKAPVVMAGGVARIDPPAVADANGAFDSEITIDLRTLSIAAVGRLWSVTAPTQWKGALPAIAIDWRGPLGAPVRTVGVSELQAGLAAIRLDDELQRIEAWKAEARRLQEQDRRRREELARAQDIKRQQDLAREKELAAQEQQRKARENAAGAISGEGETTTPADRPAPLPPVRPGPGLAPNPRF